MIQLIKDFGAAVLCAAPIITPVAIYFFQK